MTRLPYSTTAGQVSEGDTFSQLTEYLRLAEECCYTIGHLRKMNDSYGNGQAFLDMGERLARTRDLITQIATQGSGRRGIQ